MSFAALAGQRANTLGGQLTLEQLRREREARLIQAAGLGVQQIVQGGLQGAQQAAGVYERGQERQQQQAEADRLAAHRSRLAALQERQAAASARQAATSLALRDRKLRQDEAFRRAEAFRANRRDKLAASGQKFEQGIATQRLDLERSTAQSRAEQAAAQLDLAADKLEFQKARAESADEIARLQAAADQLRAEAYMMTAKSGAAARKATVEGAAADRERRGALDNLDRARGAARGLAPMVLKDPASLPALAAGFAERYDLDPGKAEDLIREAAVGTGQKQQEIDIKQKRVDDLSADRRARGTTSARVLQKEASDLRRRLGNVEKAIGDIDKDILSHVEGAPGKAAKQERRMQLEAERRALTERIGKMESQFGEAVKREQAGGSPAAGEVEKVGGTSLDRKGFDSLTEDERARVRKLVDARVASGEDKATAVREAMRQVLKDRPAEQEPPGILERARRKIGGIVEGAMVPGAAEPKYPPEVLEEYRQVAAEQGLEASKRRRELERLHPGIADAAR